MGIVFLPRTHHNNWGTQGLVQCPAPTSCVWCSGWPGAPSLLLVAAPNSPGWPSAPSLLLVAAPNSPGWPGAPSLLLVAAPNSPGWPGAPSLLWWRPPIPLAGLVPRLSFGGGPQFPLKSHCSPFPCLCDRECRVLSLATRVLLVPGFNNGSGMGTSPTPGWWDSVLDIWRHNQERDCFPHCSD